MKCPVCGSRDSRVLDSRPVEEDTSIKRRRECPTCGKRFTTYEVIDTVPVTVIKKNGSREFFDKHKLALGTLQSCPTPCDTIDGSPPDSPVPGILQARILEWVATFFSNA